MIPTGDDEPLNSQRLIIREEMQPIIESLSNINTTVNILEKTLTVVLTSLKEVKTKQTSLECHLQQLITRERALATSTPVHVKPRSETVVGLAPEPTTTGLQTESKVLPLDCDATQCIPATSEHEEEIKSPLDVSSNMSGIAFSTEEILAIKQASISRKNFAVNLMRKIFDENERRTSNVRGKAGKDQLDPDKMMYVKKETLNHLAPLAPLAPHPPTSDGRRQL